MPLAEQVRPECLDEIVGQQHILGEGKPLRRIIESGKAPNLIFYGPSGTGKTTTARILAKQSQMRLHILNGTSASLADIKQVIEELDTLVAQNGILLYLDEIQYFNKKQQQSLLPYIENGQITLIASTTENPYFYIYNAVLSRCTVFEFKAVSSEEIQKALRRGFKKADPNLEVEEEVLEFIACRCGGDVRRALNVAELCALTAEGKKVTVSLAKQLVQTGMQRYDRSGDEHYDLLSALQKSIRGSDPDAAVHYLARILAAGDLLSACRRILVTASEDIGLAYPQAVAIVKSCVDSAVQLGLPEGRIPLAQAAVFLAISPKSNSAYLALDQATQDLQKGEALGFPRALQNMHYDGEGSSEKGQHYQYPHDYPHHYIPQQYLPDSLKGKVYYQYGENKFEQACKQFWDAIKRS